MIFTRCDCHNKSMLSCEKFRPKPATRRFDESFAPVPSSMSAICTLARPRSSTKVSLGFNLTRHSSPSLGLHPAYCDSARAWCLTSQTQPAEVALFFSEKFTPASVHFHCALPSFLHGSRARTRDALLGPCSKTGCRRCGHVADHIPVRRVVHSPLHCHPTIALALLQRPNEGPGTSRVHCSRRAQHSHRVAWISP